MAYYRRRRVSRARSYRAPRRRYSGRPVYRTRRRVSRRRTGSSRVVIQVVGAAGAGVPVSAVTLGKKSARVVRRRY